MRYIGSKTKVLDFLENNILTCVDNVRDKIFGDLFCGTAVVSKHFKKLGCKIISNDYMNFSYIFQVSWIENNDIPSYSNLKEIGIKCYDDTLKYLNEINGMEGFFYKNYSIGGSKKYSNYERNYFSETNAKKIDAILFYLKKWEKHQYINKVEEYVLKTNLIDAVTKVSNISGTFGAFLKIDDKRKYKPLKLEPIEFIKSKHKNKCYNVDIYSIIENIRGDILYLDPPYNSRQYPPYYHILETISLNDTPNIYGKTGRRPYKNKLSPFCLKKEALPSILEIINKAKFKHIFLSYNTDGIINLENLYKSLKKYGNTEIFFKQYKRYKSNGNGDNKKSLKEVLFYVRK